MLLITVQCLRWRFLQRSCTLPHPSLLEGEHWKNRRKKVRQKIIIPPWSGLYLQTIIYLDSLEGPNSVQASERHAKLWQDGGGYRIIKRRPLRVGLGTRVRWDMFVCVCDVVFVWITVSCTSSLISSWSFSLPQLQCIHAWGGLIMFCSSYLRV